MEIVPTSPRIEVYVSISNTRCDEAVHLTLHDGARTQSWIAPSKLANFEMDAISSIQGYLRLLKDIVNLTDSPCPKKRFPIGLLKADPAVARSRLFTLRTS